MSRALRRLKLAGLAAASLVVFGGTARADGPGLFDVLLGFSAKETCSCAFVVEGTDEYCTAFGQAAGFSTALAIDHGARAVTATFQGISRTARADASGACLLDAKPQ